MTKSQNSNSYTFHLRSNKLAAKRQNVKPDSASSICRSSSSDCQNDSVSEHRCNRTDEIISVGSSPLKHCQDAQQSFCNFGLSSAAASVHLASTLTCTRRDEKKTNDVTDPLGQQDTIGQQTFLFDKNSTCYSNIHSSPVVVHNHRKQRAHSVIPVYPLHSSFAQSSRFNNCNHHQRQDELNAFCFSALCTSVDHPNYYCCCCCCLNRSGCSCSSNNNCIQQSKRQLYQVDYSFRLPIRHNFTSTQTPLLDQLSTITFSSLEHHHQQQHRQLQQQRQQQSSDKMTYPPPPPPEIDPAATSASYGAYSTSGNLASGYTVDENGHHVQHLPSLSEALHPDDAAAGASADHLSAQNAHYGAHAANVYDPHHTGSATDGSATHGHYDQPQSSNFFDPQIMDPPPPADGTQGHHTGLHGNGAPANGNNGYGSSSAIMTPPPPASSHGYASSPYQSGGSAPLFHRASISGPVMHSHYPPPPGNQSTTHGADVWSSTPATARPHTADGMFTSHMGGMPGQWASVSEYNRGPRGSVSSMSDAAPTSGSSKVFSYMPSNGDDSSSTAGSQGHQSSGGPRKRPRRRYDEIERLYSCAWPGCQKSYGTLNHLNAHVAMQKHGAKRSPAEFKDMRKAWRKSKREDEQRRQANAAAANEEALSRSKMVFAQPNQPFMTHTNYPVNNFMPPPTSAQNSSNSLSGTSGNGQVPRYHPQSGMYSGYSTGHNGSYASGAQAQGAGSGGLGAYLMAHRGSI